MKALIQRVKEAKVIVEKKIAGHIGKGILLFLGIHKQDSEKQIPNLIQKIIHLRIFADIQGKMNLSLKDIQGSILIVSQFTLYGNCLRGSRPDFLESAPPDKAKDLYTKFIAAMREEINNVETGIFGANMEVSLINDGPITFILESTNSCVELSMIGTNSK